VPAPSASDIAEWLQEENLVRTIIVDAGQFSVLGDFLAIATRRLRPPDSAGFALDYRTATCLAPGRRLNLGGAGSAVVAQWPPLHTSTLLGNLTEMSQG
jgi:hypothetical protein